MDNRAIATAISIGKTPESQVGNIHGKKIAPMTAGIKTAADAALSAKFCQSKRLAGREDVIDFGSAKSALAAPEFFDCGGQVLATVVWPEHILEHQLRVGRLP